MSDYSEFFLRSPGRIVRLECLEISHPSFSKVYYVVRNATKGVTVTYEDGQSHFHEYYPLKIESVGNKGDLDQGFNISFGDLSDILPAEIDRVLSDESQNVKPVVKYRDFRSDALNKVLYGPLINEISSISFTREGATFEAKAPSLNINKTGELYKLDRFPGLRGLL